MGKPSPGNERALLREENGDERDVYDAMTPRRLLGQNRTFLLGERDRRKEETHP